MSGGHYDYLYQRIKELAENIKQEIDTNPEMFEDELQNVKDFQAHLNDVAECARSLEWWMSGDSDSEDFHYQWRELK